MPWSQDEYIRAYHFAARAHRWQLYPGTSIPYIMHLSFVSMEVMATMAQGETVQNPDLALQCALLHDVLEDTRVRYEQVRDEFGEAVAQGVRALTVDKRLPRSEQMAECLPRIRQQPAEIWMVKLADRITNLQPPPRHWSKARVRDYHQEAQVILAALKDASPFLAERLRVKINEYAAFVAFG
jgi:(p)ppGpp synthase/HD superfamily hydrolase